MKFKNLLASALALSTVFSIASCGTVQSFDENKTQIFVKVFNGGVGTDWIEKVRDSFNAANSDYEIILRYDKALANNIISELKMDNATADCYFTCDIGYQTAIYNDYLEDLSDMLTAKPDGESGLTIQEKILDFDEWSAVSSKNGQGMYMLPFADLLTGIVYDHGLFVKNGWLTYATGDDGALLSSQGVSYTENNGKLYFASSTSDSNYVEGDIILSKGKDGKFGTYDDGQPVTSQEFYQMIMKITSGNQQAKSFMYNGIYDHYTNKIAEAAMAQYMGIDAYETIYDFDSDSKEILMHDGTSKVITLENGYEIYQSEGVYQGLDFIDSYLNDKSKVDLNSFKTSSFSHSDAQNDFILSYKDSTGYPAMLIEGSWWENEAKRMFAQIEADGDEEYGWGKRDFRYMLLPDFDGQVGAFGDGTGSAMSIHETSAVVVPKCKDKAVLAKIKEFLAMTLTDSVLKEHTKTSGIIRRYKYDLTDAELAEMTPFARNVWEIYHDTENIGLVRSELLKAKEPLSFASNMPAPRIPIKDTAIVNDSYIRTIRNKGGLASALDVLGYSADEWANFIATAKNNGFYTE